MLETGIPKIDEFLGGGIPDGKSLVYYIQPGVEGEVFGLQTVYTSLKSAKTVVYVASSTIVFGSLSTILDLCGEKETIEAIRNWNKYAILHDHTMIYNFTVWPYSQETLDSIKKELFNAVIAVGGIADRVIFGQYYWILRSVWIKE